MTGVLPCDLVAIEEENGNISIHSYEYGRGFLIKEIGDEFFVYEIRGDAPNIFEGRFKTLREAFNRTKDFT